MLGHCDNESHFEAGVWTGELPPRQNEILVIVAAASLATPFLSFRYELNDYCIIYIIDPLIE